MVRYRRLVALFGVDITPRLSAETLGIVRCTPWRKTKIPSRTMATPIFRGIAVRGTADGDLNQRQSHTHTHHIHISLSENTEFIALACNDGDFKTLDIYSSTYQKQASVIQRQV